MKWLWASLSGVLLLAFLASAGETPPATQPLALADIAEIRLLITQRQVIELQIENIALRIQLRDGLKDWRLDLQRGVWVAPMKTKDEGRGATDETPKP
jgi:hypothetical protein